MTLLGLTFFYTQSKMSDKFKQTQEDEAYSSEMPSDFLEFYNTFHEDSTFQMEHISFPLKGLKVIENTGGGEKYEYSEQEWLIHKPFDAMGGTFSRSFEEFAGIVVEKIEANGGQFTSIRRFAKLSGEWNLIYYQPMGMY